MTINGYSGIKGPLDGIRVIDWTMWQFGPVSTMMLADLGAEVIKVESLDGDHGRQFSRVSGIGTDKFGTATSYYFEALNRQKQGIALNLKHEKGQEVIYRLVEQSDVFVQNFRQGVAERLGLGYDDLKKHNSKIVYGSATGYGPEGPDSGKPAFALTGEARSGSLWWAGPNDDTPYNLHGVADQIAGITLSYGVLGALMYRERFGVGQKVDASHLGSMMWLAGMRDGIALLAGQEPQRQHRSQSNSVLWNSYECKDGKWIAFSMSQGDRYWPPFCKGLDRLDLIEDPRFDSIETRRDNKVELIKILDDIFMTRTREEWGKAMDAAGDTIWENIQSTLDLPDDPQVIANNYLVDFDHPTLGPTKWHQLPLTYSETPLSTRKMAPTLGENTESILTELLDYTWDDIAELQDEGVIL